LWSSPVGFAGPDFTGATFWLEYYVELYAAAPSSNPDVRIGETQIAGNWDPVFDNSAMTTRVIGQATSLVTSPDFDESLEIDFSNYVGEPLVWCGECRKLLVRNTIDLQYRLGQPPGLVISVANAFHTVGEAPIAGTGALVTLGLFGLGWNRRGRNR
jgi:hypothetical protein